MTAVPLNNYRADAAERFEALGWPSAKSESWRYFKVRELRTAGYSPAPVSDEVPAGLQPSEAAGGRVVIVDGRLQDASGLPDGVTAGPLDASAGLNDHLAAVAEYLSDAPMVALNTQHFQGGLAIQATAKAVCDHPIEVIIVATGGDAEMVSPRLFVAAGRQSQLDLTLRFVGHESGGALTNALMHVRADDGARVRSTTLCDGAEASTHVHTVLAQVGRDAHYGSHVVMRRGAAIRSEIRARLEAEGANCDLRGLYVATGTQVHDNYTVIEHVAPHTSSNEFYRGIIEDQAVGTFQGRVLIAEGSKRSEAHQLNNNLLLGEGAVANTKPQLEIDNDDVTASHGSTVGQLDDSALFYLQTRGISHERARGLLTYAFAKEALDGMASEALATALAHELEEQLAGTTDHASWPKEL